MAQGCLKCLKLTMCAANFLCFVRMSLSSSITLRSHYGITCYFYQPGGPSTVVRGCETDIIRTKHNKTSGLIQKKFTVHRVGC